MFTTLMKGEDEAMKGRMKTLITIAKSILELLF
jgi:hypothetical protein